MYSLPIAPFSPGGLIKSADMNSNFNDIATALTGSLPVNGSAGMTGPFLASSGSLSAPGISFAANSTTGFYLAGPGQFVWASNGAAQGTFGTAGLTINGTLGVTGATSLGNVSITGSFGAVAGTFSGTLSTGALTAASLSLTAPLTPANGGTWLFYGTGAGTANAQTVPTTIPAGYASLTTGSIVMWLPVASNTTAMTLAVGSTVATNVYKQMPSGPAALVGGEVVIDQLAIAMFDGTQWELLNNALGSGGFGASSNLASAATTDLGTIPSHVVNVTGTTTITSFGSSANLASPVYLVTFATSLTLTYNATSLITPTAQNITTQANDTAICQYLGSGNWRILYYNSNNTATYGTVEASGETLVQQQTVSNVSSVVFNVPADAQDIEIVCVDVSNSSASANLGLQYSVSGSWVATSYAVASVQIAGSTVAGGSNAAAVNWFLFSAAASRSNVSCEWTVSGVQNGFNKGCMARGHDGGTTSAWSNGTNSSNTGLIDRVQVVPYNAGTISGTFRLYKRK